MNSFVYLIFGEDEYLVSTKAKEILESLVPPENRVLGLEIIDGKADTVDIAVTAIAKCFEALNTMGFLGGRKVVWLRNAGFLTGNVVGKSKAVKKQVNNLTEFIKSKLNASQILFVTASKVDKRSAFYKACEKVGELHEFNLPDKPYKLEKHVFMRLSEMLSKMNLKMNQKIQNCFIDRVGLNTRQIANELVKLSVYMGDRDNIQIDDIEAVTSSSRGVLAWDLADAVGKRDSRKSFKIMRRLLFQKESHIGLIVVLENRIRELMIYCEAINNKWLIPKKNYYGSMSLGWGDVPDEIEEIFSEVFSKDPRKIHPYLVGLLAEQAKLFTIQELKNCQKAIAEAYESVVSSTVPKSMIMELLLARILHKERQSK